MGKNIWYVHLYCVVAIHLSDSIVAVSWHHSSVHLHFVASSLDLQIVKSNFVSPQNTAKGEGLQKKHTKTTYRNTNWRQKGWQSTELTPHIHPPLPCLFHKSLKHLLSCEIDDAGFTFMYIVLVSCIYVQFWFLFFFDNACIVCTSVMWEPLVVNKCPAGICSPCTFPILTLCFHAFPI